MDLREDMLREKFDLLIARERVERFERNCEDMLLVMHESGLQSYRPNGLETSEKQQVCSEMPK